MTYDDLLALLELDSAEELSFFEHFAELMETEADIPFEIYYRFFEQAPPETLAELTEGWFEDILAAVPDDQIDFYTLLSGIGRNLSGLAAHLSQEGNLNRYAGEFFRFRLWYLADSAVHAEPRADGAALTIPVSEALTLSRLEKLGEDEYFYDFSETMNYPLAEYLFPVSSLTEAAGDEDSPEYPEYYVPDDPAAGLAEEED